MSNVWLTSDTHFGHKNIVKSCSDWTKKDLCRDFPSVEEHDAYLLNQLNKFVKPDDTLYHLGDFGLGFAWKARLPELRRKINCNRIRLCLGNHDHVIESSWSECKKLHNVAPESNLTAKQMLCKDIVELFDRIDYMIFGKIGGHSMCLCHYAMKVWPWSHQLSYHLYGHSHGNLADDPNSLSMDVGMDTCLFGHVKYSPYSVEEINHIMKTYKKFSAIDHHTKETT